MLHAPDCVLVELHAKVMWINSHLQSGTRVSMWTPALEADTRCTSSSHYRRSSLTEEKNTQSHDKKKEQQKQSWWNDPGLITDVKYCLLNSGPRALRQLSPTPAAPRPEESLSSAAALFLAIRSNCSGLSGPSLPAFSFFTWDEIFVYLLEFHHLFDKTLVHGV